MGIIPTRTAIAGILGAILGMERELIELTEKERKILSKFYTEAELAEKSVQEFFGKEKCDIAVQILNPVKKESVGLNLLNTATFSIDKKTMTLNLAKGRTQIGFELLKNSKYRIFFAIDKEDIFEELVERIKHKRHHFSPYLGLAQFTAMVEFVDVVEATFEQNASNDEVEILSVVNMSKIKDENTIIFDKNALYSANNMPIEMNRNREVQEFSEVLIEKNGLPIKIKGIDFYEVQKYGKIMFL